MKSFECLSSNNLFQLPPSHPLCFHHRHRLAGASTCSRRAQQESGGKRLQQVSGQCAGAEREGRVQRRHRSGSSSSSYCHVRSVFLNWWVASEASELERALCSFAKRRKRAIRLIFFLKIFCRPLTRSLSSGGFEDSALYTSWLPPQEALSVWKSPAPFSKYEKSATLVSNSQALLQPLDSMVGKAWNMFASK